MADTKKATDGPEPFDATGWDPATLPDFDNDFVDEEDFLQFAQALSAPETSPSEEDLLDPLRRPTERIVALNDWAPIRQRVKGRPDQEQAPTKKKKKKRPPRRGKDETREGWTYNVLKWPLLLTVLAWLAALGLSYLATRFYIYLYEHFVTWRGRRERLRRELHAKTNYHDWIIAAKELDHYLGSDKWKEVDDYAYYDSKTIRRVKDRLRSLRAKIKAESELLNPQSEPNTNGRPRAIDDLRGLVEACCKNNFAGFENPRLYSETYYGTKNLVQEYVDEVATCLDLLFQSDQLALEDKRAMSKHLATNFGRTALCLSGGATFAYYHFGIAKALLDADLLPPIITGTSGGALVASLLGTRTNEELKQLLVPALAARITACHDSIGVWVRRWWQTGARFDSLDWAKRCAWFCHGSLTFLEAYQRTGRVLNVTCVPSDPHSPSILANYLTAPDCVIWSAVLASAAVPGILNPVVLMRKTRDGKLEPYSFGHKWKDGSLRTDIPLKALNLHFNVNFSIVSQVNPHINLFFFSSRGSVGRPVTHRRGRGWRGGFLGSALEQYLKLDLTKWLKVLRHLELLPRPLGQDWSEIWLQRFSGTITIWPKSIPADFWNILADPTMDRLARMIYVGQQAAFPKLNFIANRMKIEKIVEEARRTTRMHPDALPTPSLEKTQLRSMLSSEDLESLLRQARQNGGHIAPTALLTPPVADSPDGGNYAPHVPSPLFQEIPLRPESPSLSKRFGNWFGGSRGSSAPQSSRTSLDTARPSLHDIGREDSGSSSRRRESVMAEIERQSRVLFAGSETDDGTGESADEEEEDDDEHAAEGAEQRGFSEYQRHRYPHQHHHDVGEDWTKFGGGETTEEDSESESESEDLAPDQKVTREVQSGEARERKSRRGKSTFVD